jgi:hypothetical protein
MPTDTPTGRWWSHEEIASIRDRIRRCDLSPPTGPIDVNAIRRDVWRILVGKRPLGRTAKVTP